MPVKAMEKDGQWRIVEADNEQIATHPNTDTPLDGGGHGNNQSKAERQAMAINANRN